MRKTRMIILLLFSILITITISGCFLNKEDNHLTVYLWTSKLFDEFQSFVEEECPDIEIEFIAGNNDLHLYEYLAEHGELPDIITTRRFSKNDAASLCPYLLDLSGYSIVSQYYPYALQYYIEDTSEVHWLPVCGIPETMIVNKSLLDDYGISVPKNYQEFKEMCSLLVDNGIKPFAAGLEDDYAAHSFLQGVAIGKFTSLDGLAWRMNAENATDEIEFDDQQWLEIFNEVGNFIKDTNITSDELAMGNNDALELFVARKAAIIRGTPNDRISYQSLMNDELLRLPYFSQTSNDSFIYTYPSLNISLNKSLQNNKDKLNKAMKILNCFISEEGQRLIAGGDGLISYSTNVHSSIGKMREMESQIETNACYIRYASKNSFSASLEVIHGLVSGKMDNEEALRVFKSKINEAIENDKIVLKLDETYSLQVDDKGCRDAASSILTSIRIYYHADLAITPYYFYTASLYEGEYTSNDIKILVKSGNTNPDFIKTRLKGNEIKNLISSYLNDTGIRYNINSKYELPVVSGMKLVLNEKEKGYILKDIKINNLPIIDDEIYTILIPTTFESLFATSNLSQKEIEPIEMPLAVIWYKIISEKILPNAPEDYIEISK